MIRAIYHVIPRFDNAMDYAINVETTDYAMRQK